MSEPIYTNHETHLNELKIIINIKFLAFNVCFYVLITYSWGHAWRHHPNTEISLVSTFSSQQLSVNAPQNEHTVGVKMLKFKPHLRLMWRHGEDSRALQAEQVLVWISETEEEELYAVQHRHHNTSNTQWDFSSWHYYTYFRAECVWMRRQK